MTNRGGEYLTQNICAWCLVYCATVRLTLVASALGDPVHQCTLWDNSHNQLGTQQLSLSPNMSQLFTLEVDKDFREQLLSDLWWVIKSRRSQDLSYPSTVISRRKRWKLPEPGGGSSEAPAPTAAAAVYHHHHRSHSYYCDTTCNKQQCCVLPHPGPGQDQSKPVNRSLFTISI